MKRREEEENLRNSWRNCWRLRTEEKAACETHRLK